MVSHNPIPDPEDFDWTAAEAELSGAEVVDLDAVRTRRAATPPVADPDATDDAETVDDAPPVEGGPVDAADDIPHEIQLRQRERRPILADWARSWRGIRA